MLTVNDGSYQDASGNAGKGATLQVSYTDGSNFQGTAMHDTMYVTANTTIASTAGSDYIHAYDQEAQTTFRWLDTEHSGLGGDLVTVDFSTSTFVEGTVFNIRLSGSDFAGAAQLLSNPPENLSPGGIYETEAVRDAVGFFTAEAGDEIRLPTPFNDYQSAGGERSLVVYQVVAGAEDTVDLFFDANGNGNLDTGDGQIRIVGFSHAGLDFGPDVLEA